MDSLKKTIAFFALAAALSCSATWGFADETELVDSLDATEQIASEEVLPDAGDPDTEISVGTAASEEFSDEATPGMEPDLPDGLTEDAAEEGVPAGEESPNTETPVEDAAEEPSQTETPDVDAVIPVIDENAPDEAAVSPSPDGIEQPEDGALPALSEAETESTQDAEVLANQAFDAAVTYPETVPCGSAVTFHMQATGGSGTYKYYFQGAYIYNYEKTQYDYVTDPSRAEYGSPTTGGADYQFTFCASGSYRLVFYAMDYGSTPVSTKRVIVTFTIDDPAYPTVSACADAVAAQCIAQGFTTDYEKALYLHDWILANCAYDYTYTFCGPEGAFCRGTGTCETYHTAYVMLLDRVGIQSRRVVGNGHVWTAVNLDGVWCLVDATWNDCGYTQADLDVEHLYFGITDEMMVLVHSDHVASSDFPCTSLASNFYVKSGDAARWAALYTEAIQTNLDSGSTSFSLPVQKPYSMTNMESYNDIVYPVTAWQLQQQSWSTSSGQAADITAAYARDSHTIVFTVTYGPEPDVPEPDAPEPDVTASSYYQQAVQAYFGQIALSEVIVPEGASSIAAETVASYAGGTTGSITGLVRLGSTVIPEETLTYTQYFCLLDNHDISEYEFIVDGVAATPRQNGDLWAIDLGGIALDSLGTAQPIVVNHGSETATFAYCALSYAYDALSSSAASPELTELARALYYRGVEGKN